MRVPDGVGAADVLSDGSTLTVTEDVGEIVVIALVGAAEEEEEMLLLTLGEAPRDGVAVGEIFITDVALRQ